MDTRPTLLQYLFGKYTDRLRDAPGLDDRRPDLGSFLAFSAEFLTTNRPATMGYESNNFLVTFTNGDSVVLCPSSDQLPGYEPGDGRTVPSHFVPVTGGKSGALRELANPHAPQEFTRIGPTQDMTQTQAPKRYDR